MSLEIDHWFLNEIKKKIQGFENFDIDRAHNIREFARKAKQIKIQDRAIKRSLIRKFKVKFL